MKHSCLRHAMIAATLLAATACGTGDDTRDTATASGSLSTGAADPVMVAEFVHNVDQHEIQAAQLARTKATNTQVRDYASMMITDHCRSLSTSVSTDTATSDTPAGTRSTDTASTGNADCDRAIAGMGDLSARDTSRAPGAAAAALVGTDIQAMHQQTMTALRDTPKGAGFDSTYIAAMLDGHRTVLQRLEQLTGTGGTATGGYAAGSATPGTAGTTDTRTPGSAASTETTQPAGTAHQADATQTQLQMAITMVRNHLERAQDIQRTLQGNR
jgi:predicted outer membrane protein